MRQVDISELINCPVCGTRLDQDHQCATCYDRQQFDLECAEEAAQQAEEAEDWTCPECHHENPNAIGICEGCGNIQARRRVMPAVGGIIVC